MINLEKFYVKGKKERKKCKSYVSINMDFGPSQGTRENLLNHVRKNVGYFLLICEKIYTILRYNEGPLQLQSCVYK